MPAVRIRGAVTSLLVIILSLAIPGTRYAAAADFSRYKEKNGNVVTTDNRDNTPARSRTRVKIIQDKELTAPSPPATNPAPAAWSAASSPSRTKWKK